MNRVKLLLSTLFVVWQFTLSGCMFINEIDQPATAQEGETIEAVVVVENHFSGFGEGGSFSAGIAAIMMPTDWTIESVSYDGDVYFNDMVFLHEDSTDLQPGVGTDFWTDTLRLYYPPAPGSDWYVYQSPELEEWLGDTVVTNVTFELTTGAAGSYTLQYYFNSADFGFSDPSYPGPIDSAAIEVSVATAIGDNPESASGFALNQNYPNPFNPSTKIQYEIKERSNVNLTVYDITGKVVSVLVNSYKNAGEHQIEFNGSNLTSGIYMYRLTVGQFSETHKMTLIK